MTGYTFGSGGKSASFTTLGDFVQGTVEGMEEVQQTEYRTDGTPGKPLTWDDGKPRMQYKITLQTDQRDPADPSDDGKRDLYVKGARKPREDGGKGSLCAVLDAIAAAGGGAELKHGAKLTVQWVSGEGVAGAPKNYQAWYEPPAYEIQAPAAAPPVAPPAPAPAPAPVAPPLNQGPPPAWATGQPVPPPVPGGQPPIAPGAVGAPPQPQLPIPAPAPAAPLAPTTAPATPAPTPAPSATGAAGPPPLTAQVVAGMQAAGIDPGVVYGPGWEQRVTA